MNPTQQFLFDLIGKLFWQIGVFSSADGFCSVFLSCCLLHCEYGYYFYELFTFISMKFHAHAYYRTIPTSHYMVYNSVAHNTLTITIRMRITYLCFDYFKYAIQFLLFFCSAIISEHTERFLQLQTHTGKCLYIKIHEEVPTRIASNRTMQALREHQYASN